MPTKLRPLGLSDVALENTSALGEWQRRNRDSTIPHCTARVISSGALGNLERVARGTDAAGHIGMVFSDSDVYKTLEAIAWERARGITVAEAAFAERATRAITGAQRADGYLNSWFQGEHPELVWKDLRWGHELYCAGHLLQATVAGERTGALPGLATAAERLVEHLLATFSLDDGDGRLVGIGGHPEIETALVEYYRESGDERALRLAARQIELRGRTGVELPTTSVVNGRPFALSYFLHHQPVRQRRSATGHAVRELYLQAGVVDVACETGDDALLAASEAIWDDLYATKTYITGAHGSRHRDEAIGDPYELPSDRAYAETCAAIASFHWNWRLLLATGRARYAEAMERVLWNTIAGATSRHGTAFFYSNTLHLRTSHEDDEDAPRHRLDWYECACCPPNLARLMASVQAYVATSDASGLQLQLPFSGQVRTHLHGATVALDVRSGHPWDGDLEVLVPEGVPTRDWALSVRIPAWTDETAIRALLNGAPVEVRREHGYLRLERAWTAGDRLRLSAPMPLRLVAAHPRVDAVRGAVALERGPLVYCLEGDDLEPGTAIEDVQLDGAPELAVTEEVPAGLEGYVKVAIAASGRVVDCASRPLYAPTGTTTTPAAPMVVTLVPYFARAHRALASMRVWLPTTPERNARSAAYAPIEVEGRSARSTEPEPAEGVR